MNYEIVEGETVKEALLALFEKGYKPLTIEETSHYRREFGIEKEWFYTGTLWTPGRFKRVTKKEARNLEEVYEKGGRLAYLGSLYCGFDVNVSVNDSGRFLGVKP